MANPFWNPTKTSSKMSGANEFNCVIMHCVERYFIFPVLASHFQKFPDITSQLISFPFVSAEEKGFTKIGKCECKAMKMEAFRGKNSTCNF